jgi:uncharacterized membrane protein
LHDFLFHLAEGLPRPVAVFLIATLPVSELRGAIPWALFGTGGEAMTAVPAYLVAVAGNAVPVIPLLLWLNPLSRLLSRNRWGEHFMNWVFRRTRHRSRLVQKYEALGLILFVAVPLPVTGAWTGSVAAFLFGIPLRWALPAIMTGILIAGLVVSLACQAGISLWGLIRV